MRTDLTQWQFVRELSARGQELLDGSTWVNPVTATRWRYLLVTSEDTGAFGVLEVELAESLPARGLATLLEWDLPLADDDPRDSLREAAERGECVLEAPFAVRERIIGGRRGQGLVGIEVATTMFSDKRFTLVVDAFTQRDLLGVLLAQGESSVLLSAHGPSTKDDSHRYWQCRAGEPRALIALNTPELSEMIKFGMDLVMV